jgi:hypothetical protein
MFCIPLTIAALGSPLRNNRETTEFGKPVKADVYVCACDILRLLPSGLRHEITALQLLARNYKCVPDVDR